MNKGFLDTCLLVVSRDEEEQNTIEAWSISVGWNHELRIKVNNSTERVVRPNKNTRANGVISTAEVGSSRSIRTLAARRKALAHPTPQPLARVLWKFLVCQSGKHKPTPSWQPHLPPR